MQPSQDKSPRASGSQDALADDYSDFSSQVLRPLQATWSALENIPPVDLEGMLFTSADVVPPPQNALSPRSMPQFQYDETDFKAVTPNTAIDSMEPASIDELNSMGFKSDHD